MWLGMLIIGVGAKDYPYHDFGSDNLNLVTKIEFFEKN